MSGTCNVPLNITQEQNFDQSIIGPRSGTQLNLLKDTFLFDFEYINFLVMFTN